MARRSRSRMSRKTRRRSRKRSRRSRSKSRRRSRRRSRRQRGGNSEPEMPPKLELDSGNDAGVADVPEPGADSGADSDAGDSSDQSGGRRRRRKKKKSGKKRKMNAFMVAKEKARKGGADSFSYKGKTYKKKKLKTGMVVYSSK